MQKLKIIHIHTDIKFIDETRRFEGELFDNHVILISNSKNNKYSGFYSDSISTFSTKFTDILKVIKLCERCELVVVYDLDSIKQSIVLKLSKNIKIMWRFFGHELHSLNRNYSYTFQTKKYLVYESNSYKENNSLFKKLLSKLNWAIIGKSDFGAAVDRIDYFFAWSQEEYNFLKRYKKNLPKLIKIPLSFEFDVNGINLLSKNHSTIIIGNNRSPVNNHIDIISILSKFKLEDIKILIPFNYGQETMYSNKVLELAKTLSNVKLITDFIPKEEYNKIFESASAIVINTLHQGALGNIFLALRNHVKVYLNTINPVYQWLKNIGFIIFSIEDLKNDLKQNQIKLTIDEVNHNIIVYKHQMEKYSIKDFQNKIYDLLKYRIPENLVINDL